MNGTVKQLSAWSLAAALALFSIGCGTAREDKVSSATAAAPAASTPDEVKLPVDSPKLKRIHVTAVENAPVPIDEVVSPGKVEANPNRLSHVVLPVSGRVTGVSVKIGDFVRQGQSLMTIESADIDAAISASQQAAAALVQTRAAEIKAQADLDRVRDLFEHDAVAKKEVLNADAVLTQAKAAVEQSQASVQQANRRLEIYGVQPGQFGQRVAVRAPIGGKVLEMNIVPGEFRNDTSASVMTIADLSTVWVTADVPETSIRLINKGERVSIDFAAYPNEVFTGRVTQIADLVDPQTRTVKVRCELDNRDGRLRPEMFGRMRHTEKLETHPVVPGSAVIQESGRNVVWLNTAPGTFRRVAVELGTRMDGKISINRGVTAGDQVVTDGVMLLKAN